MFFSSIKEIIRLKIRAYQTFTVEKSRGSQNFDFPGKKISRNLLALKSKKVPRIFGKTFLLASSP